MRLFTVSYFLVDVEEAATLRPSSSILLVRHTIIFKILTPSIMMYKAVSVYWISVLLTPSVGQQLRVRVVNGTAEAGRLEIFDYGAWNTMCHNGFGKEEASVACRMLGFNSTTAVAVGSAKYGRGSGRICHILLDDLRCLGNETSLAQCKHPELYEHNYLHFDAVGVMCNINCPVYYHPVNVSDEQMAVRLAGETSEAGRLEIFYDREWGTVCGRGFGKTEAEVACRMLGFNSTGAAAISSDKYGPGAGPVLLQDVECQGTESSLAQCKFGPLYSRSCNHTYDIGVICNINVEMAARLVNGRSEAGRLEIFFNGEWGTVCSRGFGKKEAEVACRMLGFNSTEAVAVTSVKYGPGAGPVLFEGVKCQGRESSLAQCEFGPHVSLMCDHKNDIGVVCIINIEMAARLGDGTSKAGRLEIFFNGEWGTVCGRGFEKNEAEVACRMLGFNSNGAVAITSVKYSRGKGRVILQDVKCQGTESSLAQCKLGPHFPLLCDHSDDIGVICINNEQMAARLVNGRSEAGRLEIFFNGEWGTVCSWRFGKKEAEVACRMLGFNSTGAAAINRDKYGRGAGPVLLQKVKCRGTESSLAQCNFGPLYPSLCDHDYDIGVVCNISKQMAARLADGTSEAGRLEIFLNEEWGTVCSLGFGKKEAEVACRMLGFKSTGAAAISLDKYSPGAGPVLLQDVKCQGTESSLAQCDLGPLYPRYCPHIYDVGVVCNINEQMAARLVNGTSEAGRLEIFLNGEWGTVCGWGFGKKEAEVACRMLGLKSTGAAAISSVRYGPGAGPVLLNDVECQGTESSLAQCELGYLYKSFCNHTYDVGVMCYINKQMAARLINGTSEAGRLEIFFDREWGTVCSMGFGKKEAEVACRMLGFKSTGAAAISSVKYGRGAGHVLFQDVKCQGTESSLAQCEFGVLYESFCDHEQDVGVICNSRTRSMSRDKSFVIAVLHCVALITVISLWFSLEPVVILDHMQVLIKAVNGNDFGNDDFPFVTKFINANYLSNM